jgi:cytochrome c peroxidase
MNQKIYYVTFLLVLALFLSSCKKDSQNSVGNPVVSTGLFDFVNIPLPAHLRTNRVSDEDNTPSQNRVTDAGAMLGRYLFYDKNLSFNNKIACASCHQQAFAFSDPEQFSTGFAGGKTGRNSMSLIDSKYYKNGRFFWDERSATAEAQASRPMMNPVEMGMPNAQAVVDKLKTLPIYPDLYQKAFGSTVIDSTRTVQAIAQFVRSIVSFRTKYDEGRAAFSVNQDIEDVDFPNFSAQENLGKSIFFRQGQCDHCHANETFTMDEAKNNGLDLVSVDNGVGGVTKNTSQNGLFKVPSLRGIAQSAPYMHDGRFKTLAEVVEHYNNGVKAHPNLSEDMRNGGNNNNGQIRRMNLTQAEKNALVAFLETLSDTGIATDVKFSSPF